MAKCRSKVLQNVPREHSAIFSTFIKLPFVFKTIVLSIFEWPLKTALLVFYSNFQHRLEALQEEVQTKKIAVVEAERGQCLLLLFLFLQVFTGLKLCML